MTRYASPPGAGQDPARAALLALRTEISKAVVGQDAVVSGLVIALLCRGHVLLEGVPGVAKTLLVRALAAALQLDFKRVQFTPDLMPGDITGSLVYDARTAAFTFREGPVFTNLMLADEINRTPPKTQAALLEAMQEKQVSVGTKKYLLEKPFFVLATQNPIEQEGTYALPEAQLDRFMYLIVVDYPETADEIEVLRRTTTNHRADVEQALDGPTILKYQQIIREVLVRDDLYDYAVRLVQASRITKDTCHPYAREWVSWGAGPRACQNLVLGAKAHAFFAGRTYITTDDIRAVALPVLRHRIIVNYAAVAEGIRSDDVVRELVKGVSAPADKAVA